MTIDSDSEEQGLVNVPKQSSKAKSSGQEDDALLNPDFTFDLAVDPYGETLAESYDLNDHVTKGSKPVCCRIICSKLLTNL